MDTELHYTDTPRRPRPQRRQRSKLQIFKENYLPFLIVLVTFVLMLVFIIGGINKQEPQEPVIQVTTPSESVPPAGNGNDDQSLAAEAQEVMAQVMELIEDYDYPAALEVLNTFSGNISNFPELNEMYKYCVAERAKLVPWNGAQVMNLSVHVLIADPVRAFNDDTYGRQYRNNFITTTEFSAMLLQLYSNGYILVSLDDLYELTYDATLGREVYVAKTLLLPPGKTPILLTETNANYYTYMTDHNRDGKPDANADGFAYKLCYGENGFYNEYVMADGTIAAGAYDVVPLLEAFIAEHPDFSYKDARAIIAVTGYDGILGYRVNSTKLTAAQKEEEKAAVAEVVNALRETGYDIACFTYDNVEFDDLSATEIYADLEQWQEVVASVIGSTDILVYPKEVDISDATSYNGNVKFNVMYDFGYRFFLGTGTTTWDQVDNRYVRHNRLMVTGSYLLNHTDRYALLFDVTAILDPYRANFV